MLSKVYDPKKVEPRIYKLWMKSGFFNPDKLPKTGRQRKTYAIALPPPNITGILHMGHALNTLVQDILIRARKMQGFETLWVPGIDHAGIAAQNVVEKELRKEGLTRFDIGRKKFLERMWLWKEKYGHAILEQLKKMGASCDWSRLSFTMDQHYSLAVATAFAHYFKKGWIYRAERVVNWCPRCQSSLSDLELEYREEKGKLWFIRYPMAVQNGKYITVATTRPETMLGDTAVAVNPKDQRYQDLIGQKVILPLSNREIPIIADRIVHPDFGTGMVKVTPGHDLTDYEIGIRHNLKIIKVIDEQDKITQDAPQTYRALSILEARQKVIEDLKASGLLEKEEDFIHQVPKCYRCHSTLELLPSQQWFLKMEELAGKAKVAVRQGKVKFHPKRFEKIYFEWLKNIRDWCISRQIWWGHRLPIWECQAETDKKLNKERYFLSLTPPQECRICGRCTPKQTEDMLDTWFSSALWPFAILGWPQTGSKSESDLLRFYPTDVLSTDRGIINLWVARMIFSGMEFVKKVPFRYVYIHPTVLTREGKRMSKSLGTGMDPMMLIENYGADATRFGIAWQLMGGQDIRFTEDHVVMGKKFCNKIWNASRFVLIQTRNAKRKMLSYNLEPGIKNLTREDQRILRLLSKTITSINEDLKCFRFGKASHTIYHFFWHHFCDQYIEISKKQKDTAQTQKVLWYVLVNSLKLLHPFVPFITEEIYQKLNLKYKKPSLMVEQWPRPRMKLS